MDSEKNIKLTLGARIRELRVGRDISQQEMADYTGLNRAYISSIENGKKNVTIEILIKLALVLEVQISALFEKPKSKAIQELNDPIVDGLFLEVDTTITWRTMTHGVMAPGFGLFSGVAVGVGLAKKFLERNKKSK